VFSDEFDGDSLDTSKWRVAVTPSAASMDGTTSSTPLGRPSDGTSVAGTSSTPLGRPHADCAGYACVELGSCRDAACTPDNVYLKDGQLVMQSSRASSSASDTDAPALTTGAVNTWGKAGWRASDGDFRVCISARLPGNAGGGGQAQGIWPAHWLMPHDDSCGRCRFGGLAATPRFPRSQMHSLLPHAAFTAALASTSMDESLTARARWTHWKEAF
jgi:hypothetical protein